MPVVTTRPCHSTVRTAPTFTDITLATTLPTGHSLAGPRRVTCAVQYLQYASLRPGGRRRRPAGVPGAGGGGRAVLGGSRPRRDPPAVPGAGGAGQPGPATTHRAGRGAGRPPLDHHPAVRPPGRETSRA